MPKMRCWRGWLLLALLASGLLGGCQKKSFDAPQDDTTVGNTFLGSGNASELTLLALPSDVLMVEPDKEGVITITALVKNSLGELMPDDTTVTWTASVGTLEDSVTLTKDGTTSVKLTFPVNYTGWSEVRAFADETTGSIRVGVNVTDSVIAVTSNAANNIVAATGRATITARVTTEGQFDSGVPVTFSLSSDNYGSWSGANSDVTDSAGRATVNFQASNEAASATDQQIVITAETSDGRKGTLTLLILAPENRLIFVTSNAANNTVAATDTATIIAKLMTAGQPDSAVPVTFTLDSDDYGNWVGANLDVTDTNGRATVNFQANNDSASATDRQVTITATTDDGRTGKLTLLILAPENRLIIVTSDAPDNTLTATGTATITATLTTAGQPDSGIAVTFNFTSTYGYWTDANTDVTDAAGQAMARLQASNTSGAEQWISITVNTTDGRTGTLKLLIKKL